MTRNELIRLIKDSLVVTGLRKVETIERRKRGEPLEVASDTEYLDFVNEKGSGRLEWKKLPVADDQMIIHEAAELAGICECGATVHKDSLMYRCCECGRPLCPEHRHCVGDKEYVCGRHYFSWLVRKVVKSWV